MSGQRSNEQHPRPGIVELSRSAQRWNSAHPRELPQRDIAHVVGITTGAVQRIINELEADGYITSERIGRRNRYSIDTTKHLRHPLEDQYSVDDLISTLDQ